MPLVLEMAREMGVELDRDAAEELSEILNGELASIRTEIEKLAAYAGERRKITRADVELLVVSAQKYTVWELADMLAARQPARALEFLDSLLREGEPLPHCSARWPGCIANFWRRRNCPLGHEWMAGGQPPENAPRQRNWRCGNRENFRERS